MKAIIVCVLMVICAVSVMAERQGQCSRENEYPNPAYGLTRGFANVMFGWLEIPRGFTYENSRIPLVGVVSGPIKGAFLTTWREMAGVIDIVSMGLSQEGAYFILPDYVWDAPWLHRAQYKAENPDQTMTYSKPKRVDGQKKCGKNCVAPCKQPCPPMQPMAPQQKPCELAPPAAPMQPVPPAGRQIRRMQRIKMVPLSDAEQQEGNIVEEQDETETFSIEDDNEQYSDMVRDLDEQVLVIEGRAAMVR